MSETTSNRASQRADGGGRARQGDVPAAQGAGASRARVHLRHHSRLRLLPAGGVRHRDVLCRGRDELGGGVRPVRDHRGGRLPADDRRRVRPLRRLDDRLRRHRDRDPLRAVGLADVDRYPVRLRRRDGPRRGQRVAGDQDRPAELHRHPRLSLHPAGPDHLSLHRHDAKDHHRRGQDAAEGDWLAVLFGGEILGGLFQWMGDRGWIDVFERGSESASRSWTASR